MSCWMEVRKIFILYFYTSSTSPYHPSEAIFSRDEYQSDTGNLPHIHLMISLDLESMSVEQKTKISHLIRASVMEIVHSSEVQDLINEGIINSFEDVYSLQDLAKTILAHHCNQRCLRRIEDVDGPENFKCRKPDNFKISPDNTRNFFLPLTTKNSSECVDTLVKIGMDDPIVKNEFNRSFQYFHPT